MKTMKKLLLSALLLLCGLAPAHADGYEEPITFDRLPQAAQTFLKTHFDTLTVAYIVADRKFMGVEYEVKYTDRTEVDFRSDGQWESVERKYAPVPAAGRQFIKKIERDPYTWEIELSGGLEIKFDTKFNVIGYDD